MVRYFVWITIMCMVSYVCYSSEIAILHDVDEDVAQLAERDPRIQKLEEERESLAQQRSEKQKQLEEKVQSKASDEQREQFLRREMLSIQERLFAKIREKQRLIQIINIEKRLSDLYNALDMLMRRV